jgi:hypothetical protein
MADDEQDPDELDIGALLRQAFDQEKGEYPPYFLETVGSTRELEEEISRQEWPAVEERLLRRFFASIGQDYDIWRRERQRRRLQQWGRCIVVLVSLAALLLGIGAPEGYGLWPFVSPQTPTAAVVHYGSVAAIQPYFSLALPAAAPTGYRLVDVLLAWSPAGTPRATLIYRRAEDAATATLAVRAVQDEPAVVRTGTAQRIVVAGRPAWWVENGPSGRGVTWEEEGWACGLTSQELAKQELLALAAGLCGP